MKIQASNLITNMAGSVNGQTIRRSRYGLVLQNKAYTPTSSHVKAQLQKQIFSRVSFLWKSLSENEIKNWETYAQDNPILDKFGNLITLSGIAYFKMIQQTLLNNHFDVVPAGRYSNDYDTITDLGVLQTGAKKYELNYTRTDDYGAQSLIAIAVPRGTHSSVAFANKIVAKTIVNNSHDVDIVELNIEDKYNYDSKNLAFAVFTLTENGGKSPLFWAMV